MQSGGLWHIHGRIGPIGSKSNFSLASSMNSRLQFKSGSPPLWLHSDFLGGLIPSKIFFWTLFFQGLIFGEKFQVKVVECKIPHKKVWLRVSLSQLEPWENSLKVRRFAFKSVFACRYKIWFLDKCVEQMYNCKLPEILMCVQLSLCSVLRLRT